MLISEYDALKFGRSQRTHAGYIFFLAISFRSSIYHHNNGYCLAGLPAYREARISINEYMFSALTSLHSLNELRSCPRARGWHAHGITIEGRVRNYARRILINARHLNSGRNSLPVQQNTG